MEWVRLEEPVGLTQSEYNSGMGKRQKLKTPTRSRNSEEVMSEGDGCIRLSVRREKRVLMTEEDDSTQIPGYTKMNTSTVILRTTFREGELG